MKYLEKLRYGDAETQRCGEKADYALRITLSAFRFPQGGFTLLELLISITLVGIIVIVISGAMRLGFRSIETGDKKIESLERKKTSLNIIDSQIQSQIPLTYDEDGSKKFYFNGDRGSMTFTTNYSIWSGQKGYVLVNYSVGDDMHGRKKLLAVENTIGTAAGRETHLLEALDDLYFEYYYKDPTAEKGEWVDEWTDNTKVPEKVRLHIVEGSKDLSMLIRLRVRELSQTAGSSGFGPLPQQ